VKPPILLVLILPALYTWRRPNLGHMETRTLPGHVQGLAGYGLGAVPGFYDGFLGPGTESRMAMAQGNKWIRGVFLMVVWVLIARLGWNLFIP
jgi:hypothetical protein